VQGLEGRHFGLTSDDLDLVASWRSYLDAPERYLRHLLTD